MPKLKVLSGLVVTMMGATAAQASGFAGPYVGAKAGINFSRATSLNSKKAPTAGVEAGYNWNSQDDLLFGLSAFYDYNGKETHTGSGIVPASANYGSQVYGVNLKLGIPTGRWLSYAKVGYARVDGMGNGYVTAINNNTVDYGVGLEYKLMPNLGVAAEWDGNNATHANTTLHNNNFTLGINYYFGASEARSMPVVAQVQPAPKPQYKPAPPKPKYKTVFSEKPVTLKGANFATDSAKLTPAAFSQLDRVVRFAKRHPNADLSITGYTDSRGPTKLNQALSERRAESVKAYLVSKGLAASRIKTIGDGEADPIASNATAAGRAQNRRVEIRSVIREKNKVQVNP